ncbi:Outer membrane protein [Lysobacter silvestris]|uniref:Translocation and assembly module subunit TamA n=2 Tax=Solilutibacter silvestris TaxID=1645665 RepID=A0A2K1Q118_9GAMM|nr:autotransporter assembly complex family protein [Lysobacter silvestris]PNS08736.1 Outer membrane protein [Lysobacter silvestris]
MLCCLACASAQAAQVMRVDIRGIDGVMASDVRASLSLQDAAGKKISDRRLDYLLEEAETETRNALEPYGYYSPQIKVTPSSDRNALVVVIEVQRGEPVRVRKVAYGIEGPGGQDQYLTHDLDATRPVPGSVFDQSAYEAGKTRITQRLAQRGYFDADFITHKVEVTRAAKAADVDLRWTSGERYEMGAVTFEQTPTEIISPQLLEKLVYWNEGDYYHQGRLDRLRKSLLGLDYFGRIDIEPLPGDAKDLRVPVQVTLEPAKRTIYTAGVSYGTDSGPGARFGLERRYLNKRGHKALAQVDYAQKRKVATLQYRVPALKWLDGWYTAGLQFADEQSRYIDSRRSELVFSRTGQINTKLDAAVSLHVLRERWAYTNGTVKTPYQTASLSFPQVDLHYISVDDRLYPRRGIGANFTLRGGSAGYGGAFAQAHARAQWFHGLGPQDRLILRGELGYTVAKDALALPPSLRFFAGGDRSIRGYNWREVGPRLQDPSGRYLFAYGAKNVVTSSVEYERYFNASWGAAAFVDGGSAFDGRKLDWHNGVGIGLRWRSPVGPVRIDIARGLKHPDSPFTLSLNIGADL